MIKKSFPSSSLLIIFILIINLLINGLNCDLNYSDLKLLIISFDGFGHHYLRPDLTPNLYQLSRAGTSGHMLSTFSTKTLPNHHSISTGLYQDKHGIIHNQMYDKIFDEHFIDNNNGIDDKWWNTESIAMPLFIANQLNYNHKYRKRQISCCSPWIGCHVPYHGYRTFYMRKYNKSSSIYEQFDWTLDKFKNKILSANFCLMYIHEPDIIGHRYGPYSDEYLNKIKELDRFIGYVVNECFKQMNNISIDFIILSDHGLADIRPYRSIIIEKLFPLLNQTNCRIYGSNPLFTVQVNKGYENHVRKIFEPYRYHGDNYDYNDELFLKNQFIIYSKQQIPKKYHYHSNDRRLFDYIIIANEGWSIYRNEGEKNCQSKNTHGQHGYDNFLDIMRPLFLAYGPSFRKNYYHDKIFSNIDLYPLISMILNIKPNQYYHQGNLFNVYDMLSNLVWK